MTKISFAAEVTFKVSEYPTGVPLKTENFKNGFLLIHGVAIRL